MKFNDIISGNEYLVLEGSVDNFQLVPTMVETSKEKDDTLSYQMDQPYFLSVLKLHTKSKDGDWVLYRKVNLYDNQIDKDLAIFSDTKQSANYLSNLPIYSAV